MDMTASNKATLVDAINNMDLNSSGNPLGPQLQHAGDYFEGHLSGNSSPISYACQPNFVIAITDGASTGTDPIGAAANLYTLDHSSTFAGMQNAIVHVIAFALPQADKDAGAVQALKQVATAGGGSFFQADNAAELEKALQNAISQILTATYSFATPVVPTTGTNSGSRAYLASFQSNPSRPFWRGYLKAFNRDSNGLIAVDSQGIPLNSTLAWDAGQQLSTKAASSRTLYTYASGARQSFATSNTAITTTLLGLDDVATYPDPSGERTKLINFTRGIDAYDEDGDLDVTEERSWKLGDVFHSTPVLVTPPSSPNSDSAYATFRSANASRTSVLIAGANDGMLHAFRESDGAELWSFIPPDLLDNLKGLTPIVAPHDYFVDASPIAADVKIGGAWKTIVVFGERRGGKNYYALDITDTTNPQYLWSFTDSKIAETWSEPAIGKIRMSDQTDKWVAFVGGGYDTASNNNTGKAFFVIDLSNGTKLWEYYKPASPTGDQQYMNFSLAANPTAVDLNNDGYIDRVYIGDVGGQMWKFDMSAAATLNGGVITNWTGKRLFAASSAQANPPAAGEYYPAQGIYVAPTLAYDTQKNLWIYFGTGDRNHPNNSSTNRFYGIMENTTMTNGSALTEAVLGNATSGAGAANQGWFVVLNGNEKVLSTADVFNKAVYFTAFTPATAVTCDGGAGTAKLYSVNLTTGDAAINFAADAVLSGGQSVLANAKSIGSGIPSRPVVVIRQSTTSGNPYVITGTTNQQITNTPVPPVATRKLLAWREVF
jgi:type IV pilus assembly protein PilY1